MTYFSSSSGILCYRDKEIFSMQNIFEREFLEWY